MQLTSINLLAAGLSLLSIVDPLHSDPQRFYWANYEPYPSSDPSSIQKPLPSVTNVRQPNHFRTPSAPLDYPTETLETKYPQSAEHRDYHDFGPSNHEEKPMERGVKFNDEDAEDDTREQEIEGKMKILDDLLSDDLSEKDLDKNGIDDKIMSEESRRVVRAVRRWRPGFFWTLARVTFEMVNDTRSAIKQISDIVNNNIAPDSATQSSMMRESLVAATSTVGNATTTNGTATTTTEAPFVLTRSGLQRIIRRNVLGLVRLFNIEWSEAWNQSETNVREFQRDLGNQVGMYLRDNPNAY
ncbi:uncharacterized protein LOC143429311 [Xylocopa sonorina]|uniref:uncharacterized protein LOC143429311 n=1 Tax=Xylocopa sonorina TaxID=1818115 RepID=UPI00403AA40E